MIDRTGARLWYGQERANGRSAIARNAFAFSILARKRFPDLMTRAARVNFGRGSATLAGRVVLATQERDQR